MGSHKFKHKACCVSARASPGGPGLIEMQMEHLHKAIWLEPPPHTSKSRAEKHCMWNTTKNGDIICKVCYPFQQQSAKHFYSHHSEQFCPKFIMLANVFHWVKLAFGTLKFLLTPLLFKTAHSCPAHSRKMLWKGEVGLSLFSSAVFIFLW